MEVQVFDWRWQNENTAELQAVFNGKFGKKPIKIGDGLSFLIKSGATCAGCRAAGVYSPCSSAYPETKPKCQLCRSREGSFIYTVFDGFNTENISDADLEKIKGEHVVYLALFDRGTMKIGVSKIERKTMRQIEQGSHATMYLATTPDGISARQIETLIRKKGMADKIQSSQKRNSLRPQMTNDEAENLLNKEAEKAKEALKESQHLLDYFAEKPEFVGWASHYQIPDGSVMPIKLGEGEGVSGVIKGMKGAFVVIGTGAEVVAINMKSLRGKRVDFSPMAGGVYASSARQSVLF